MKFKDIQRFVRGLFKAETAGQIPADDVFTTFRNVDLVAPDGVIRRRPGAIKWADMEVDGSESIDAYPVVDGNGFGKPLQAFRGWGDNAAKRYVFSVADGKVAMETDELGEKTWTDLNAFERFASANKIDMASYYDRLFFNDSPFDVWQFDAFAFSSAGYHNSGERLIYFQKDRVMFLSSSTFLAEYHETKVIGAVSIDAVTMTYSFTVSDAKAYMYEPGDKVVVEDSTGNDGTYTVNSSTQDDVDVVLVVEEAIVDATADGTIKQQYRIKINSEEGNTEGKTVWDSLVTIEFIGADDGITTFPINTLNVADTLKFSFCRKIGKNYYVLEDRHHSRNKGYVYIVKFNDRFVAQNYYGFEVDVSDEQIHLKNFAVDGIFIYLFCHDHKVYRLNTETDAISEMVTGEFANIEAPIVTDLLDGGTSYEGKLFCMDVGHDDIPVVDGFAPVADSVVFGILTKTLAATMANASKSISAVDQALKTFTLASTYTPLYVADGILTVSTSTGNDGAYTIASSVQSGTSVVITVDEAIPSAVADGVAISNKATPDVKKRWHSHPDTADYMATYVDHYLPQPIDQENAETGDFYAEIPYYKGDCTEREGTVPDGYCQVDQEYFQIPLTANARTIEPSKSPHVARCAIAQVSGDNITLRKAFVLAVLRSTGEIFYDEQPSVHLIAKTGYILWTSGLFWSATTKSWLFSFSGSELTQQMEAEPTFMNPNIHLRIEMDKLVAGTRPALEILRQEMPSLPALGSVNIFYGGAPTLWYLAIDVDVVVYNYIFAALACDLWIVIEDAYNDTVFNGRWAITNIDSFSAPFGSIYRIWFTGPTYPDPGMSPCRAYLPLSTGTGKIFKNDFTMPEDNTAIFQGAAFPNYNHLDSQGNPRFLILNTDIDTIHLPTSARISPSFPGGYPSNWQPVWDFNAITTLDFQPGSVPQLNNMIFRQVGTAAAYDTTYLKRLGALREPMIRISECALTPVESLAVGQVVRYSSTGVFYDGTETPLSSPSDPVTIPSLPTGTQVAVVVYGVNLQNYFGGDIHAFADIETIKLYRQDWSATYGAWGEWLLLEVFIKSGLYFVSTIQPTNPAGEFWDTEATLTYSPYTIANAVRYACAHIVLHKSRLVLVNNLNLDNASCIMYSETDLADSIPPTNIREIESGDGEPLVGGASESDFLYLFKPKKIYAIAGDVYDGQLIDVEKNNGTRWKNLVCQFGGSVFFVNETGIFRIDGMKVSEVTQEGQVRDLFNSSMDNCLDFSSIGSVGFSFVNHLAGDIFFCVPRKVGTVAQADANYAIIYNARYNHFREWTFRESVSAAAIVQDVSTSDFKTIAAGISGKMYMFDASRNDAGKGIDWSIKTKDFPMDSNMIGKVFRLIKVHGKFLNDIHVKYWIDGEEFEGSVMVRDSSSGYGTAFVEVYQTDGPANRIAVEISGSGPNDDATEIDEILIGYENLGGVK